MKFVLVLAAVVILSVPAISMQAEQSAGGASPSDGAEMKALRAINLQDFDGNKVPPDELKGSIVLLDFWATWCGPCIAEVPMLNRLQEKYADRGVKVVGVTMASGNSKEIKPVVGRANMKYRVLIGDDDQAYDFNIIGFPTTYLITKDMKVFRKYIGSSSKKAAMIEADIEKLLGEKTQ